MQIDYGPNKISLVYPDLCKTALIPHKLKPQNKEIQWLTKKPAFLNFFNLITDIQ